MQSTYGYEKSSNVNVFCGFKSPYNTLDWVF